MELYCPATKPLTLPRRIQREIPNLVLWGVLVLFLFLVFFPIIYLVIMSFKSYGQIINDFWALPKCFHDDCASGGIGRLLAWIQWRVRTADVAQDGGRIGGQGQEVLG